MRSPFETSLLSAGIAMMTAFRSWNLSWGNLPIAVGNPRASLCTGYAHGRPTIGARGQACRRGRRYSAGHHFAPGTE